MKKIIIFLLAFLFTSTALADKVAEFPVHQLFGKEDLKIELKELPEKPLVKKIIWVLTPNVTFVEAPYYTRGLFGGLVVKKQIVMHTTWVWTPVEVWE